MSTGAQKHNMIAFLSTIKSPYVSLVLSNHSNRISRRYSLFQHSMLYFFHHYELPVILQQAQLQQILFRNHAQPQAQPTTPSTVPTTPGSGSSPSTTAPSSSSPSSNPLTSPTTQQTQQNYITELSQLDVEPNGTQERHVNDNTEQTSSATATIQQRNDSVQGMRDFYLNKRISLI